jgi:osmotically-inducible protein OsmY
MQATLDSDLEKTIHDRLQKAGIHMDEIRPIVDSGNVKLIGTLHFETQRRGILKIVTAIDGVKRVEDQMLVEMKKRK